MLSDYVELHETLGYSDIKKDKVDCVEGKRTWLSSTTYSQPMSKGRITFEDNPNKVNYPKPNPVGYTLMTFACDSVR